MANANRATLALVALLLLLFCLPWGVIALYGLLKPQPAGDQGPEEGVEALRAGAEAAVRALEAKIMEQNGQE